MNGRDMNLHGCGIIVFNEFLMTSNMDIVTRNFDEKHLRRTGSMRVEYFNTGTVEGDSHIRYCGYEDTLADFSCGPNIRDCYLFHYIVRGEGYYKTRGKTYRLKEGDIFCIFPRDVVYYYTVKEKPWSFYWFSYNGRRAPEFTLKMGFTDSASVQHVRAGNCIPELMDELIKVFDNTEENRDFLLLCCLYHLFAELEASYLAQGHKLPVKKSSHLYVDRTLQYISANYHRSITVRELACEVGLERTYFSKLFARIAGMPPQEYLLRFRLEKALSMLKETDLRIGEIGRGVGIDNPYYFSRAFKALWGVSPGYYRKEGQEPMQKRKLSQEKP